MSPNTRRRLKFAILSVGLVWAIIGVVVLHYSLTVHDKRLRYALNLDRLPRSVNITEHAEDIWTDYIVHFSCHLDPADFDTLISGRPFVMDDSDSVKGPLEHLGYWSHLETFDVAARFSWFGTKGDQPPDCEVYVNQSRDRVYIVYGED